MINVFSEKYLEVLAEKVRTILKNVGYQVDNAEMSELLTRKGLKRNSRGRFSFDDAVVTS